MENPVLNSNMGGREGLVITPQMKQFLFETAKWAKFLSIIGFVMIGLFIVLAIVMSLFMGTMMSELGETNGMGALGGGFVGVIYALMGLIYLFPVLYLYRFATKMKIALQSNDEAFLSSSFENLKSCYKFLGIFMAVILVFYAIGLIIAVFVGGAAAFLG